MNLTNKLGHTTRWKVSNYVNDIEKYLGRLIDVVLVNDENPSAEQIAHYKLEEGDGVLVEDDFKDVRVLRKPLLSHQLINYSPADKLGALRSFIRHDSDKLAKCISDLIK